MQNMKIVGKIRGAWRLNNLGKVLKKCMLSFILTNALLVIEDLLSTKSKSRPDQRNGLMEHTT